MHSKLRKLVLVLVCILYVAVRFWHLTDSCLWFDEIFSVHAVEHSWDSLLSFVAVDLIHPPLFYALLKLWIGAGGESLLWLRMFPVLFAVIALFPFIALCRELRIKYWTQILALFFLATNGALIKYSQEVRMYSLLLCLSLFSMWLFVRCFDKSKSFIPLVLVNLMMVYTHYFGWFVVLTEIVAVLIFQRVKWRQILTMFAIEFVCFVPWIYAVWNAARSGSGPGQNIGWMSRPGPWVVIQFMLDVIEPFYYQATSIDPASVYRVSVPILVIAITAIALYFANWKQRSETERKPLKILAIFAVLPLMIAFIMSWLLPYSTWGTRHLIIVFAPLAIVIAIVLSRISSPVLNTAAITLILLFTGYAFVLESRSEQPQYSWCAWESLAGEASAKSDAKIYAFEDLVVYHVWFAMRNQHANNRIFKVNGIDGITEDKAYFLPRGFEDVRMINMDQITDTTLWVAYRSKTAALNEAPITNFIDKGYRVIGQQAFAAGGESAILVELQKEIPSPPIDVTRGRALELLKNHECWNAAPYCDDIAGLLIDLYENGDDRLLVPLLDAGEKSDGALSESLGMFYGDVLENDPITFLSALKLRRKQEQIDLCFLAIRGDGSGRGDEWEQQVRNRLNEISEEPGHRLRSVANLCVNQIGRFHALSNE